MMQLLLDAASPGLIISLLGGAFLIVALVVGLLALAITMIVRKIIRSKKIQTPETRDADTHSDMPQ